MVLYSQEAGGSTKLPSAQIFEINPLSFRVNLLWCLSDRPYPNA